MAVTVCSCTKYATQTDHAESIDERATRNVGDGPVLTNVSDSYVHPLGSVGKKCFLSTSQRMEVSCAPPIAKEETRETRETRDTYMLYSTCPWIGRMIAPSRSHRIISHTLHNTRLMYAIINNNNRDHSYFPIVGGGNNDTDTRGCTSAEYNDAGGTCPIDVRAAKLQ